MAISILAALTDKAREQIASGFITGIGFEVVKFGIGNQGHDPLIPVLPLTPDPTLLELPGQFFGPEPIDSKQLLDAITPSFECILQRAEAVGGVSSIGLYAISDDPEVGEFLFAVGHKGLSAKSDSEQWVLRVNVRY